MSADKRTVSTDALETLGTIIGEGEQRDAIHLAVLPVVSGARLYPGQSIDAKDGIATPAVKGLGIVDPFLAGAVQPEQRFWMVLRPRIIKSLRHVWTHPDLPDEPGVHAPGDEKSAAMAAITSIGSGLGYSADELIEGAIGHLDAGEYMSTGAHDIDLPDEFWPHFEAATGRKVPGDKRYSFFSCSC